MAQPTPTFSSRQEEMCQLLSCAFPEFENLYMSTKWRHTTRTRLLYHLLDIHMLCNVCADERRQHATHRHLLQCQKSVTHSGGLPHPQHPVACSTTRLCHQNVNLYQRSCNRYQGYQGYSNVGVDNSGRMRSNGNGSGSTVKFVSTQDKRSNHLQEKIFNLISYSQKIRALSGYEDNHIFKPPQFCLQQDTVPSQTASHLNISTSSISFSGKAMSDSLACAKGVGARNDQVCEINQPNQIKAEKETGVQCASNHGNQYPHARQADTSKNVPISSPSEEDLKTNVQPCTCCKATFPIVNTSRKRWSNVQNKQEVGTRRSVESIFQTKFCSRCNVYFREDSIHVCNHSNEDGKVNKNCGESISEEISCKDQASPLSVKDELVDNNENYEIVDKNENNQSSDEDQTDTEEESEDSDKDDKEDPELWYQIQKFKIFSKPSRRGYCATPGPKECLQCQVDFPNPQDLREHLREHSFFVPIQLKVGHRNISTEIKFCKLCKHYFKSPGLHIPNCVDPKPYKCISCKRGFPNKRAKINHVEIFHEEKKYLCDICGKIFGSLNRLRQHKVLHADLRSFVCTVCGTAFNSKNHLKRHQAIHDSKKQVECKHCHRWFTQSSNLKRHLRTHTGEKPYKCDLCTLTFTHNVSLKTHKKSKHGIDWWASSSVSKSK